jgi:hypothetical protein
MGGLLPEEIHAGEGKNATFVDHVNGGETIGGA